MSNIISITRYTRDGKPPQVFNSYKELAEAIGVHINTVYQRVHHSQRQTVDGWLANIGERYEVQRKGPIRKTKPMKSTFVCDYCKETKSTKMWCPIEERTVLAYLAHSVSHDKIDKKCIDCVRQKLTDMFGDDYKKRFGPCDDELSEAALDSKWDRNNA